MKEKFHTLSKNEKVAVFVALGLAIIYIIAPLFDLTDNFPTLQDKNSVLERESTELLFQDLEVGSGPEAEAGDKLFVHYSGTLTDGSVFDSSYEGAPFSFVLGRGEVIVGWDEGLLGMKKGGSRLLVIPPSLGYGEYQISIIPPNSTLIFEVNLLEIEKPDS